MVVARRKWLALGALATGAALVTGAGWRSIASAEPKCGPPEPALRWPDVAPVFDAHCASCHDSRKSDKRAALAVFDQSRYPFTTQRPTSLVNDLRHMFATRGGISDADKCKVLAWLAAGAPDAQGRAPSFR